MNLDFDTIEIPEEKLNQTIQNNAINDIKTPNQL